MGYAEVLRSPKTSSSRAICTIATRNRKRWHIAHITTADRAGYCAGGQEAVNRPITCEVTPHHLVFTDELVATLGCRRRKSIRRCVPRTT